jgi:hypothetical protein
MVKHSIFIFRTKYISYNEAEKRKENVMGLVIKAVKFLLGWIVSISVGKLVKGAIVKNVPYEASKIGRILVAIGGWTVGLFIGDKIGQYVDKKFDETVDEAATIIKETQEVLAYENKKV